MTKSAKMREDTQSIPPTVSPTVSQVFNLPSVERLGANDTPRSVLTKARIVKIEGPVTQDMSNLVINELLYLEAMEPGVPITMLINSGGGSVDNGWAIIDMMNMISSPVHTCAIGRAASMGVSILLAGAPGHRSITPNAYLMIHEASIGGVGGQAADVSSSAEEIKQTKERMLNFYSEATGQPRKVLAEKMRHDYNMFPIEALELGFVDKIAGYPECKNAFNAVARKSNEAHMANNKKQGMEPA